MWWLFTNKIRKHDAIRADETVYQACYGLGGRVVQLANRSVSPVNETWAVPKAGEGLASSINRTGVIALTDHRLIFFAKRFAIGNVGKVTAQWPLDLIHDITYEDETLTIAFADESVAGLHVPKNQSPNKLIAAFQTLRSLK